MKRWLPGILAVFVLVAGAAGLRAQSAEEFAGTVVRLQKAAVAVQDALPRPLKVGDKIYRGDVISTGRGSRVEIKMLDDSIMTLGERASFTVIDFIAVGPSPTASLRVLEGAFAAVSGTIAKVADAGMTIETRTATIGIRGTGFWGGTIDGDFQIALLTQGSITVENKAGRVVLDKIGTGTLIQDSKTAPTDPKAWAGDKLDRAKNTVAFQ